MKISIGFTDKRYRVNKSAIRLLVSRVLSEESAAGKSLSIVYCRDKEIAALNRDFLGKKGTTDVLAFDLGDDLDCDFLGEIYVNLQQTKRQAEDHNVPYLEEVKRVTVHGLLHLLGYSDSSRKGRQRMWSRQEGYL